MNDYDYGEITKNKDINILSIVGFILSFFSLNIISLILCVLGLKQSKNNKNEIGKGFAIAGIVINIIFIIVKVILLIFIIFFTATFLAMFASLYPLDDTSGEINQCDEVTSCTYNSETGKYECIYGDAEVDHVVICEDDNYKTFANTNYFNVLNGSKKIKVFENQKEDFTSYTFDEYLDKLKNNDDEAATGYLLIDLNQDEEDELVIQLDGYDLEYVILFYDKSTKQVYGYENIYGFNAMKAFYSNGYILANETGSTMEWYNFDITTESINVNDTLEETIYDGGPYIYKYNSKEITSDEFDKLISDIGDQVEFKEYDFEK